MAKPFWGCQGYTHCWWIEKWVAELILWYKSLINTLRKDWCDFFSIRHIIFLSELKLKGSYDHLNFVILKKSYMRHIRLRQSVHSMQLLFRLLFGSDSGFYLSKLSQNIRENEGKIVCLRFHCSERSVVKFKLP